MQRLNKEELQMIYDIIDETSEINDNYHALVKVLGPGNQEHWLHAESDKDFEDATKSLWRFMCETEMIESTDCKMYFVSDDAAFVSDPNGIYGSLHQIFDHGKSSFINIMWYELAHDIKVAMKEDSDWTLNGWTIDTAVDEMVALWQTGSCDDMPWDIIDKWDFISEEFHDVTSTQRITDYE